MYNLQEIRKTVLGQEVEHKIRYALGQRLTTFDGLENTRPEHLRFDMSGDRDSNESYYHNLSIFKLFNFPLYLDLSYNTENLPINRIYKHSFIFHKGTPTLCENGAGIHDFAGDGTVDILILLTYFFGDFDNFIK